MFKEQQDSCKRRGEPGSGGQHRVVRPEVSSAAPRYPAHLVMSQTAEVVREAHPFAGRHLRNQENQVETHDIYIYSPRCRRGDPAGVWYQ